MKVTFNIDKNKKARRKFDSVQSTLPKTSRVSSDWVVHQLLHKNIGSISANTNDNAMNK